MDKIEEALTRGVQQVLPNKQDLASLMAKRKIKLYQGFDASAPSLHLGNYAGLMKLRQFQKLGHEVVFLVGDFTGMIGDPSDKLSARPKLTREQVVKNLKAYKEQASKVLNFDGENPAKIMFNSSWSDKITFQDLIEITSNFTVQQMIERDMFQERLKNKEPIYLHEFLYPVAQAYDSVVMDVDLEIGGNDQLFNMMAGRTLMGAISKKEKFVLTTKLLIDKEGKKVGKTTGNALFLNSKPEEFYAGIMSFPDEVIYLSFELLTEVDLTGLEEKINENPMKMKKELAFEVVKILWGNEKALKAGNSFKETFQEKLTPKNIKIVKTTEKSLPLLDLIFITKEVSSRSEAKRLISQNAIDINGELSSDPTKEIEIPVNIKIGKSKFVKIVRK
ncbi:MAG: tyrosine--tRNA ligase [Candidatus Woesebacteria bacterium]|nr:tyrosine--tRNA ligase [Candidatus Woesebacteria bacterium]